MYLGHPDPSKTIRSTFRTLLLVTLNVHIKLGLKKKMRRKKTVRLFALYCCTSANYYQAIEVWRSKINC